MKFREYREMLTRNFSPGVPRFYQVSNRNALKKKELKLAHGLHLFRTWEELAEDPFRGLRAGPADFSPFSLLPRCPGILRMTPNLQHPELPNTAEVCPATPRRKQIPFSRPRTVGRAWFQASGSRVF